MAPERFDGWSDRRSDVYSLGVTLYELLTLRPAFAGGAQAELIEQVLHDAPTGPASSIPKIPRDLETIVLKAIAKEPGDRYPTAQALGDDLQRFLEDRPIRARRSTAIEQFWRWCRRNPWLAGRQHRRGGPDDDPRHRLDRGGLDLPRPARPDRRPTREIREAETLGRERLFESLTAQARARRLSRQMGQRFDSLEALAQAAAIARELKLPARAARSAPRRGDRLPGPARPEAHRSGHHPAAGSHSRSPSTPP